MIQKLILVLLLVANVVYAEAALTRSEKEQLIKHLQDSLKEDQKVDKKIENEIDKKVEKKSNSFFYMGYGIGVGSGKFTREVTSSGVLTESEKEIAVFTGTLKLGYAGQNNNRWELSITGITAEYEDETTDKLSGVDIDWYAVYEVATPGYKPFWSIGLGSYVWEDTESQVSTGENIKGGAFNLGLGVYIDVNKKLEVELAYKIKGIGWQELVSGTTTYQYGHSYGTIFVGLNYRFND